MDKIETVTDAEVAAANAIFWDDNADSFNSMRGALEAAAAVRALSAPPVEIQREAVTLPSAPISAETKAALDAIDANIRNAAVSAGTTFVGQREAVTDEQIVAATSEYLNREGWSFGPKDLRPGERHYELIRRVLEAASLSRPSPGVVVTDEMMDAAVKAIAAVYYNNKADDDFFTDYARAALEAALSLSGEEPTRNVFDLRERGIARGLPIDVVEELESEAHNLAALWAKDDGAKTVFLAALLKAYRLGLPASGEEMK